MKRVAFFIMLPTLLCAQEFRASITGQVTDSSGAAVADATVTVASVERNTSSQTVTNAAGRYLVQFLLPGTYTVGVEKSGFKKFQHTGITLEAADHVALDITLEVGALSQDVTVTGEAPLLETEGDTRAATIENRVLENVPTNGRNLFSLQYTLPGVIKQSTYWGSMELWAYTDVNGVSIKGGRRVQDRKPGIRQPRAPIEFPRTTVEHLVLSGEWDDLIREEYRVLAGKRLAGESK